MAEGLHACLLAAVHSSREPLGILSAAAGTVRKASDATTPSLHSLQSTLAATRTAQANLAEATAALHAISAPEEK